MTQTIPPDSAAEAAAEGRGRRLAWSTAVFSAATGLSRVLGLIREIVARRYFGVDGPGINAFTVAFQVPNLVRSLFADSALSAAFVPVFTELLEHDRRKDALHLASALFGLILCVLSAITVVFIALAGVIMPIFTGPEFSPALDALTVGLSRVLFPIVILTMVIEHMSVIWEESGPAAAIKEAAGSLVVAILGYLVMTEPHLTHLIFLFPETLLILLAIFIIMGRYTGYRVTELIRFKDIVEDATADARSHP